MSEKVVVTSKGIQWREKVFIYPNGLVTGQEVVDKVRAEKAVSDWIWNELKGHIKSVTVSIHEDLIFRKSVPEKEIEPFLAEIPIDPEKMAKSITQNGDLREVAVMNQDLLDLVTKGLATAKIKVTEVEPKFSANKLDNPAERNSSETGSKRPLLSVGLGVVLIGVLGVMGIVIWKSKQAATPLILEPVSPEISTTELTPTTIVDEEKAEAKTLKILVLNGSGVTGKAAEVKDFLLDLGYVDVAVGNAESDQATSEARLKPEVMTAWIEMGADLRSKYLVASEAGELESDHTFEAVIILGRKL